MSGEKLHRDLKRMETAYLEQNRREFEITRHVSLLMIEPSQLVRLRETGKCDIHLPEALFDLERDPEEIDDRGTDPALEPIRREARARLEAQLDPARVDAAAKARQRDLLRANGGREAVIARGDLGFSVPPGVAPMFD